MLPSCMFSVSLRLCREAALFDMASASSVQVVTVIEPLIQYSSDLFPEGMQTPDTLVAHQCPLLTGNYGLYLQLVEFYFGTMS